MWNLPKLDKSEIIVKNVTDWEKIRLACVEEYGRSSNNMFYFIKKQIEDEIL